MSWVDNLSREELLDQIEVLRDHRDFIESRNYLLQRALGNDDLLLVEALLRAGAGPDWVDDSGETLLHDLMHAYRLMGSSKGPLILSLAELLLRHGADPNLVGSCNWRALDHCIEDGLTDMTNLLIRFGGDPVQREFI